ncbi:MAG: two-component system sensor histidine kinase/response regulator [Symploca sp. SIO3E6]|nr:two-component system sensor histidine kinase/response regulator [Caldora sp. SIO3E6]
MVIKSLKNLLPNDKPALARSPDTSRRNQAVRMITGVTVLLAGFCAYYSYRAIRSFTLENVKQNALLEVKQGVDDIDKWLARLRERVETLAYTPTIQTLEWSKAEPYLQLELQRQRNPALEWAKSGIYIKPRLDDQTNFFKFTLIDAKGYRIGNTSVGDKPGNLSDRQYFRQAIAGNTYSSDAIISRSTGFVQINIATPIWSMPSPADSASTSPNQPIGVFAGSVKIDRVTEVIQQLNYGKGSYAFALNSEGQAMVHPDPSLVSTREKPAPSLLQSNQGDLAAVAQRMIQRQKGIEMVRLDGKVHYIAYLPLEEANWSIGLVIPRTVIEGQLFPLNLIVLMVAILTITIILVLWRVHVIEQAQLHKSKADAEAIAEAASAANRAKSEFLSQISHELRTPLNGILGYAQILQLNQNLSNQQLKGLNIIHQSGNHLLMLINDILDLAKIEARKLELFPTTINLYEFLSYITSIIQMRAAEKHILFNYHAALELPTQIEVDEKRLRQILLNLLGNAVKFTDTGSVTFWVRMLQLQGTTVTLQFEISDTGVGIQEQHLASIFAPFEQVREGKHHREGTGLGLAITRQLVEKMGGVLQVASEWGKGSKFWFELTFPIVAIEYDHVLVTNQAIANNVQHQEVSTLPLIPPPLEELNMLHQLAQFGNMQKIWDYANYLESLDQKYQGFAHQVKDFTDKFEDEKIIEFVEQYLY